MNPDPYFLSDALFGKRIILDLFTHCSESMKKIKTRITSFALGTIGGTGPDMFDVLQPVERTNSELFLIFFVAALHVSLRNGPISVSSYM